MNKPRLIAPLYIPSTHHHLIEIARGEKLAECQSIIFCMEDAVSDHEFEFAYQNMAAALCELKKSNNVYRFIRTRSPEFLLQLLQLPGIEKIDGFVLPKFTAANLQSYMAPLIGTDYWVMPILETIDVFSETAMHHLADLLANSSWRHQILSLRIGGNDLFALLKQRRPANCTIYETAIGPIISRLVTTFVPRDFVISAPVFEFIDDTATFNREVLADIRHGLVGKTVIHPKQIPIVEQHHHVTADDIAAAHRILDPNAPGVFRFKGAMCEPKTHHAWSKALLQSQQGKNILLILFLLLFNNFGEAADLAEAKPKAAPHCHMS